MSQGSSIPANKAISRLAQELGKLPGIGPKSAQRIAFHLLRANDGQAIQLADALLSLKQETKLCPVCFNVTDVDECGICSNEQRDRTKLCVVEQPQDILALERTGIYKGLYHVLHGAISPSDGIRADDIRIGEMMDRLQDKSVTEIIMATNPNFEGEQTALYLHRLITPLGITVTRLARGLPFGTEVEYADDVTLTRAIEGRQTF